MEKILPRTTSALNVLIPISGDVKFLNRLDTPTSFVVVVGCGIDSVCRVPCAITTRASLSIHLSSTYLATNSRLLLPHAARFVSLDGFVASHRRENLGGRGKR